MFTTIALFTVLRIPMMRLPYLIRTLINFNTGFNRLCEFLNSPEQHRDLTDSSLPVGGLRLDNVTALHQQNRCWRDQPAHRAGGTGGITGATGAGKSCLLHLIAGFDNGFEGSIRRHGRVAHLGHKPWLMNDTIRNNILFGQPWHGERYRWVLGPVRWAPTSPCSATATRPWWASSAPASGGQQQRVALARALYAQADILLLDNPLGTRPHRLGPGAGAGARLQARADPAAGEPRSDVLAHCDRVIRIEQGRLVELDAHQLADLIQHPRPTRRCRLRRRSSSARRRWWRQGDWGCSASCGSVWPPPAPSCSPCCSPWARRGCASPRISGSAARPVTGVSELLGIYVLLGAGSLTCIMVVRVINYKLGLKLAWTLFDGMLGRISQPHGLLRQGAAGAYPQPLRSGSGEAQEILLSMLMGLFGMLVSVALQVVVIGVNMPLLLLIAPW